MTIPKDMEIKVQEAITVKLFGPKLNFSTTEVWFTHKNVQLISKTNKEVKLIPLKRLPHEVQEVFQKTFIGEIALEEASKKPPTMINLSDHFAVHVHKEPEIMTLREKIDYTLLEMTKFRQGLVNVLANLDDYEWVNQHLKRYSTKEIASLKRATIELKTQSDSMIRAFLDATALKNDQTALRSMHNAFLLHSIEYANASRAFFEIWNQLPPRTTHHEGFQSINPSQGALAKAAILEMKQTYLPPTLEEQVIPKMVIGKSGGDPHIAQAMKKYGVTHDELIELSRINDAYLELIGSWDVYVKRIHWEAEKSEEEFDPQRLIKVQQDLKDKIASDRDLYNHVTQRFNKVGGREKIQALRYVIADVKSRGGSASELKEAVDAVEAKVDVIKSTLQLAHIQQNRRANTMQKGSFERTGVVLPKTLKDPKELKKLSNFYEKYKTTFAPIQLAQNALALDPANPFLVEKLKKTFNQQYPQLEKLRKSFEAWKGPTKIVALQQAIKDRKKELTDETDPLAITQLDELRRLPSYATELLGTSSKDGLFSTVKKMEMYQNATHSTEQNFYKAFSDVLAKTGDTKNFHDYMQLQGVSSNQFHATLSNYSKLIPKMRNIYELKAKAEAHPNNKKVVQTYQGALKETKELKDFIEKDLLILKNILAANKEFLAQSLQRIGQLNKDFETGGVSTQELKLKARDIRNETLRYAQMLHLQNTFDNIVSWAKLCEIL